MRIALVAVTVVMLAVTLTPSTHACGLDPESMVLTQTEKEFMRADLVALATVTAIEGPTRKNRGSERVTLKLLRSWKGNAGREFSVENHLGFTCQKPMTIGVTYLLFARRDPVNGTLTTAGNFAPEHRSEEAISKLNWTRAFGT